MAHGGGVMRVLMVSPHAVYSPRGTPISVFNRCLALCALGHEVDLVTYPVGDDRHIDGLRYLRAAAPGVRSVPAGPSFRKVVLNGSLTVRSLRQAARGRTCYDVVHTHGEAGMVGPTLARMANAAHIYDMGNDWADMLSNWGLGNFSPLTRLAAATENAVIRRSDVVIAHVPLVAHRVESVSDTPVVTVFNSSLDAEPDPALVETIRSAWTADGAKVVLYTGTLEMYQGVPLLLEAMVRVAHQHPTAVLTVLGGQDDQIEELERLAASLGISANVRLVGPVPTALVPACLMAADVLVSPRLQGKTTPLKIFSYLRSGRPIVATDVLSHTQVLGDQDCVLVPPTAVGLANGISSVLDAIPSRRRVDQGAQALRAQHGIEQYISGVSRAYRYVGGEDSDVVSIGVAAEQVSAAATAAEGLPEHQRVLSRLLGQPWPIAV